MTWNIKKFLLVSVVTLAVLLAVLGLGIVPINLFFAKKAISEAALERLGMQLEIKGPLRLRLGFNPSLSASSISLRAPGSADQSLATIEMLTINPRLLNTLNGNIDLRSVEASGIVLDYGFEWASRFLPASLDVRASAPLDEPLNIEINGSRGEKTMRLVASGASLNTLLNDPEEYPAAVQLKISSIDFRMDGLIMQPFRDAKLHAQIDLDAKNVSVLLATLGLHAPGLDELSLQSNVRVSNEELRVEDLTGALNEIPFKLSGLARNFTSRPWFDIEAELSQLDLAGFAGKESEAASEKVNALVDLQPFFDRLSGFDGRAKLQVNRFLNAPVELGGLLIEASLDHDLLSVDDARLILAGSELAIQAALDMRLDCARLDTRLQISGFDLANLNSLLEIETTVSGQLEQLLITTSSCGVSLNEHVSSLQTNTVLTGFYPQLGDEEPPLNLDKLDAQLNWDQPSSFSFLGALLGESLSGEISFGSVDAVWTGTRSPLNISIRGDAFTATMTGDGAFYDDALALDVVLAADVQTMGSLHSWLGTAPDSQLSFHGRTGIRLDATGLSINNLDAVLGRSDLAGTLNWPGPNKGLPASAELSSARLDLREIAGAFPAKAAPERASEWEWSELLDENEWIERWFSLPAININLTVTALDSVSVALKNVKLQANLRDRLIQQGQLNLQFEGIDLAGKLNADFQEQPWTIDYESELSNIDIGRLLGMLELAENVDAHAQSARVSLVTEGNSLRQLLVNSKLDARIEALHWALDAGPEQRRFDINLSELELVIAPSSPTTWRTSGTLNGTPLKAWMQSPTLPTTFDPAADLPLTLVVGSGNHIAMLDMTIKPVSEGELSTDLVVSGVFTNPANVDFTSLTSPLDDYEFRTRLSVSEAGYLASDLEARVGASTANGTVNIRRQGPGFHFDLDLRSPFLETDDLVGWAADFRKARQIISNDTTADDAQQNADAGMLLLANQYIDEFSGQNSLEIRAEVEELRSAGKLLGSAQLQLIVDDDEFQLDPVRIALPGGNVKASYHGNLIDGGYEYALDLNIERLEYGGLLRLLDSDSKARGEVYLDASLVSRTPDAEHAMNHLQGHFDLAVFPEDIEAGFLDLWASNLIFALLPTGENSGKKLNCMVARFDVENGVMKSKNTFLDSTDIIVRARGDIDLAKRQLDLLVAPQAKLEKFLSVSTPIAVTGPFNDYRIGVAPGGFFTTLFRWYYGLIYVPWKRLTGEKFPPDGIATCYNAMNWELPPH